MKIRQMRDEDNKLYISRDDLLAWLDEAARMNREMTDYTGQYRYMANGIEDVAEKLESLS